jgi:putative endonuclease
VYILTNKYNSVLYIGVTGNLAVRIDQHKNKVTPSFTARYNLNKLVYYEITEDPISAITREKQLKGWSRKKKQELITSFNPKWKDLTDSIL